MDGDREGGALGHGCDAVFGQLIFGLLTDVDITVKFGTTAPVDNVLLDLGVADDGRV